VKPIQDPIDKFVQQQIDSWSENKRRREEATARGRTLTGVVQVVALEHERPFRDGARVELQAEHRLAPVLRRRAPVVTPATHQNSVETQ